MMCKAALAVLFVVGLSVLPAEADFIVYAPGSAVTPAPSALSALPGQTVNVPIYMMGTGTGGTSLGVDVELTYDTNVLHLVPYDVSPDVTKGMLMPANWSTYGNTNTDGDVYIGGYGATAIPNNGSGVFLNVLFNVDPNAPLGATPIGLGYDYGIYTFQSGSINIVPEPSSLACLISLLATAGPVVFCGTRASRV